MLGFGKGSGGKKPVKKPGTGARPTGNPRPTTQTPKTGRRPR